MNFLHPALLAAGLAAVSIPVIIHLLMRRRRKPVPWGAMRFLMEAHRRTRRRLLIERWLLLAARCLLIALVALALGRPFLGDLAGTAGRTGGRAVYILLDNSIASQAESAGSTAFARHREAARATLAVLGEGDRAGLILLASPAEDLVIPPSTNLASVTDLLGKSGPTDARADLSGALASVAAAITEERARDARAAEQSLVVLLSDLPKGSADLDAVLPRLPAGTRLLVASPPAAAAESSGANISILAASPQRTIILPDQADLSQTVTVSLRRSGSPADLEREQISRVTLRLHAPGTPGTACQAPSLAGETTVTWSPGQRDAVATVAFSPPPLSPTTLAPLSPATAPATPGPAANASILVASIDADPIRGDNLARVAIERRETLRVGLVAVRRSTRSADPSLLTAADWFALALRPRDDAAIEVLDLDPSPLDIARLAGLDALVITSPDRLTEEDWAAVRAFASPRTDRPALVLVTPPGDKTVHTWTDALARGLSLEWSIAREARTIDPVASPAAARLALPERPAAGLRSTLGGLRAELLELIRPVSVQRILPLLSTPDGASMELSLGDGTGLLWVTTIASRATGTPTPASYPQPAVPEKRDPSLPSPAAPASHHAATQGGLLVYLAAAPELRWTDLPVKPLMVPMVQEILREGIGAARGTGQAIAGTPVSAPAQSVLLKPRPEFWADLPPTAPAQDTDSRADIRVTEDGTSSRPLRNSGVWDALDSASGSRGCVVVNPDAAAADLSPQPASATGPWLSKALTSGAPEWIAQEPGPAAAAPDKAIRIQAALSQGSHARAAGAWLFFAVLALALVELTLAWRATPRA